MSNLTEKVFSMKLKQLCKPRAQAFAMAALSAGAVAAPVTFTESVAGTGFLPGTAEVVAGGAHNGLTILGNLVDGRGGNPPNVVDMYGFSVSQAGRYFFDTFGSDIFDPQLFLFDTIGNGLYWNNDASITPSITQSSFSTVLGAGNYFIAFSFYGVDPADGLFLPLFDTLNSNEGTALAGSGAVAQWVDAFGQTIWDRTAYSINIRVPEPGALALSLAALGLLAGVSRRRQATLA